MRYEYNILNYWKDQDDLYVNYIVNDKITNSSVNTINYYNVYDIDIDYNTVSIETIENNLYKLIKENNGMEFKLPKVSELSRLLKYVYDYVCESESNMCHIDYQEWEELKEEEEDFDEEHFNILKSEIDKYNLDDYISIDSEEYKICAYGGLQCCFNDDRDKNKDSLER